MTSLSFSLHASYSRSSVACFSTCWRFQNPSSATTFSSSRASAAAARSFSSHASSFLMSSMCSSEFSLSTLPFSRFITSILDDQASSSWVCLVARIFSERYEFVASTRSSTSCGSGGWGQARRARTRRRGRGSRNAVAWERDDSARVRGRASARRASARSARNSNLSWGGPCHFSAIRGSRAGGVRTFSARGADLVSSSPS